MTWTSASKISGGSTTTCSTSAFFSQSNSLYIATRRCSPCRWCNQCRSTHKLERTLRIFRGRWRARSSQYRSLTLQDVLTVVRFCFNLVSVELVFRPFGRCKESQWAVNGLQRCVRWWLCFGSMSSVRILPQPLPLLFTRRYVDNRVHVYLSSMCDLQEFRLYVHPGFFSRPIVLEEVEMDEV